MRPICPGDPQIPGIPGDAQRPGSRSSGMKQNSGAVWSGRAARRPPPAACRPPECRPVVFYEHRARRHQPSGDGVFVLYRGQDAFERAGGALHPAHHGLPGRREKLTLASSNRHTRISRHIHVLYRPTSHSQNLCCMPRRYPDPDRRGFWTCYALF
jgi:hypothetical protein